MTRLYFIALIFVLTGCIGEGTKATSKLELNVGSVNFCERTVGESFAWNDLQLLNTGKGPLDIQSILVRGDEGCAFQCFYRPTGRTSLVACPPEGSGANALPASILAGETLLVRVVYTPGAEDNTDQATLVINTNADNTEPKNKNGWGQVLVPLCGTGVPADTDVEGDAGADSEPDGGPSVLDGGAPGDCGDCGAPLPKGAPGCETQD
jgi:hypothetical protein